ncbi:MAG: adenylosuccinate synthetase [Bacteroidota bacterium]
MKVSIVLGLGYGDEGKGLSTAYLCQQSKKPLVIRFSGGHQAGHTVVDKKGHRHVFSNFGAGTLQGVPTYWSRFCTFNPLAYWKELQALAALQIEPTLYLDALAMVTTPYDIAFNQKTEQIQQHGSCGVGFGATLARNQTPNLLFVQDLLYPQVMRQKLKAIRTYYAKKSGSEDWLTALEEQVALFCQLVDDLRPQLTVVREQNFFKRHDYFDHYIFEGSQGILLDMDHGFFPNVTYANTTSKNAFALLKRNAIFQNVLPEIFYITRAYQTRHGNGFLSNEHLAVNYKPNPQETNQYNPWQGQQRVSPLDLNLLNYALDCDLNYSNGAQRRHLIITCMDQLIGNLQATVDGHLKAFASTLMLQAELNVRFSTLVESHADDGDKMVLRKRVLAA